MAAEKVTLYLYDLSRGLAKIYSRQLAGQQFDGIWHTSIVVYGTEYYYASGIQTSVPGQTHHGQPMKTFDMGETFIPKDIFLEFLNEISHRYSETTYDLFDNNCNNFSNEVSQFLTGKNIPEFITNLPREALNTPLGPLVRQFSQAIANQINRPESNGDTYGTIQNGIQSLASIVNNPANNDLIVNLLGNIGRSTNPMPNQSIPNPSIPNPSNINTNITQAKQSSNSDNKFSLIRTISTLDQLKQTITDHCFVIIDFTMESCPPCRAIAPIFEKWLKEKTSQQSYKSSCPVPNIVAVRIDVRQCDPLIPRYYGVSATPTFAFIKNGKESARIVGANRNEIENKMNEMIKEAQNSKPCIKLNMQNKIIPLQHNIFDEMDNYSNNITDLETLLVSNGKLNHDEWAALMKVMHYISGSSDLNDVTSDITTNTIQKSIDALDASNAKPLLEILKKFFLNSEVKEKFIMKKDTTILNLIKKFNSNENTEIQVLLLKILCNWCNNINSVNYVLSETTYNNESAKDIFINYLSESLLSEDNEIAFYGLKLLNNIAIFKQYINNDDEERDINVVSALVQILQNEDILKTSVLTALTSLYLFIFENQQSSVIDLLDVFDIKTIISNLIKSFEKEMSTTEDQTVKTKNELLKDLSNRIIAMIDYLQN